MFAPGSAQPGVGGRGGSTRDLPLTDEPPPEQQPISESLPRLSTLSQGGSRSPTAARLFSPAPPPRRESSVGGGGSSGRFSPAPPPPRESNAGGSSNSGRFSRVSARSIARRAADDEEETDDDGHSSRGLSSPGMSFLPSNLRQAYDSLPALPKPSRIPRRSSHRTAAMQLDDELDEALMGSSAGGGSSSVKFQVSRRSLTRRQDNAAEGDLPDGEEDDILRSMSSPMVRMPSMRHPRALQQQLQEDYRSERHMSSPIPGLILGRDEPSGGSSPAAAARSGSFSRNHSDGFGDTRHLDDAEGGGRLLSGALDILHRVQNSAEAGASRQPWVYLYLLWGRVCVLLPGAY